jgi:hypothetical protein
VQGSVGTKKASTMSGAPGRPALASYRDAVTELVRAGERFGNVEAAIDEVPDLTLDEKAALWMFAFSLRDWDEQERAAPAHLTALP